MSTDDKYPESTGRRRFVKGVVGSATLAGVGTGAAAALNTATSPSGAGGGTTEYFGVENTAGPAPRAMPQIPIEIDDEGFLRGVFPEPQTREVQGQEVTVLEMQLGGITYSANWFQYCGVQGAPGLQPDSDQDNYFHYTTSAPYEWMQEIEGGARVNVEDFADYKTWGNAIGKDGIGKPAMATWRSQDVPPAGTMPVQIIRSERIKQMADQGDKWLSASTEEGFIAILDKCTHFCCVPKFKADPGSAKFGAQDDIYCPCHQSVYDPFSIVKKSFVALPRPESEGE